LEEYARRVLPLRRKGELRGISTGFPTLDKAIGGYHPEQLITLFGLPKHGKSTMMLKTAMTAVADGLKVLYVTFEMSGDDNRDRLISLLADVPLTKWIEGAVPLGDKEDEIYTSLRKNAAIPGFTMVEDPQGTSTVTTLNQILLEERPDIVFVDSAYLMNDELGEPHQSNQALINIVRGLKRMAQSHKIPVIISTQALASRSRNGLNAGSVANSSVFRTDSDTMIGVEHKTSDLSEFKVVAARQGRNTSCYIRIDWQRGVIEEVDPTVAAAEIAARVTPVKGKLQAF
jgi:replicative DNA helicase